MSKLAVVRDEKFQDHVTPEMHPESPRRLEAIDKALHRSQLIRQVKQLEPRPASEDELAAVHDPQYIEELMEDAEKAQKSSCLVQLDPDTWMSPESYDTAKLAAGAGLVAVDAVRRQGTGNSFVVVRPPGHHALAGKPMGFCLFNNIAVAARYAQEKLGYKRIFIVDWDVHHGNGTQDMFFNDPSVFFVSFHQFPFWPPESGWYTEEGAGDGKGYNLNIPLPAGTGDRGYLKAWDELVSPVCHEYEPELILLSAGYDAHQFDPLGQQLISTPGYARLASKLREMADSSKVKIVGFLEGGYNTRSLSDAVVATMQVLNAESLEELADAGLPGVDGQESEQLTADRNADLVDERIKEVRRHFSRYWSSLR